MPVCNKCYVEKELELFEKNKRHPSGRTNMCKECANAKKREGYKQPHIKEHKAAYRKDHAEEHVKYQKEYREKNKDILLEKRRTPEKIAHKKALDQAYCQANPEKICAKSAKRRAGRNKATPGWANQERILEIYAEARRIQEETGIPHQIDHVTPLQSPFVTGLHCEANLQVLTAEENARKSNLWWPDMPDRLDYEELLRDYHNALEKQAQEALAKQ